MYWMVAARRSQYNPALERCVDWCNRLGQPLVVLEALRAGYPHASDRIHRFVLDGMLANQAAFGHPAVLWFPYLEREPGEGRGLLKAMASRASVVVTDLFPAFMLPAMTRAGARQLDVLVEAVDSNGWLPLTQTTGAFTSAHQFRRLLQKRLPEWLPRCPEKAPLERLSLAERPDLSGVDLGRWPAESLEIWRGSNLPLREFRIDHGVLPVAGTEGGEREARRRLAMFLDRGLDRYLDDRRHPDEPEGSSGLSPYLHFGHISSFEVVQAVLRREGFRSERLSTSTRGSREGWWGLSPSAEAFLDQILTWRELSIHNAWHDPNHDIYEGLPVWARKTLESHQKDPREVSYGLEDFRLARTHDALWNAAQRQLLQEGTIHNTLRMLWGKKILEWANSPREAFDILKELNDRYALDGRDPNSYSGISWIFGRYDRPWGPERPVFGTVRFMSSTNMARKVHLRNYLQRFGEKTR